MGLKKEIFETQSKPATKIYNSMLKWLDGSFRRKLNDPGKLLNGSGIQPGQKVLEMGCGSGYFTIPAARRLGETGQLISIDLHPSAVEETNRKVEAAGIKNVIVQREDALHTSFSDEAFDLILLFGVIPAPFLPTADVSREAYRLLKPGGIYAIWTLSPFWNPKEIIKTGQFESLSHNDGVFCLKKRSI